ncbi:MAG: formyltransferase family protein [Patescibacteria group bacterium]
MKLAILTSNQLRHYYFADSLAQHFETVGLVLEEKKRDPSTKGRGTDLDSQVKKYFANRSRSEEEYFGSHGVIHNIMPDRTILLSAGTINENWVVDRIVSWGADCLAVFGSSILGNGIITRFPGRIFNMHLGLSPYYRGSGTNFWPLYEAKLGYVGVTIHYIDPGIDSGPIIVQGRPKIEVDDTPHSIGNKTIIRGVELMIKTLKIFLSGHSLPSHRQDLGAGKLYRFADCSAAHLVELEKKFTEGLVRDYLRDPFYPPIYE